MNTEKKIFSSDNSKTTVIIRLMVGAIFLSEGIQKFLYPMALGPGRFEKIGFIHPEFWGNFVGIFEILCGAAILIGFFTRAAAIAMLIEMSVSILITKIPIIYGQSILGFNLPHVNMYNFWSFAHEARTDFAMWMGSLFLLIKGGGCCSIDRRLSKQKTK